MNRELPTLSKSRFMAGLQCHKRLYLECFHRELADPVSEALQAIFDSGTEVGELARRLYAGGLLIAEDYLHHEQAVTSTTEALSDTSIPALFEAAFRYDDIRIRADILARTDDGAFDLIEVKSATQVKEENIPDVTVQLYVLGGCGIRIRRASIGHLNGGYLYPGGDYDIHELFAIEDVTNQVQELLPEIPRLLAEMREPLHRAEPPLIGIGRHCTKPFDCPFIGHCHAGLPEHHIFQLPRARETLLASLNAAGIEDIGSIPTDFPGLSTIQRRVRECVASGNMFVDGALADALGNLEFPIHFLDFETFNPALPLYPGTRPYQIIPFQWSDYILEKSGGIRHEQFLHDGPDDPREPFTRSLIETLGTRGSIVVYSSFEASRIRELADTFPAYSAILLGLVDNRFADLLQLIRQHCYHPLFHGSFSIKAVLPALAPGFDYSDLAINDGMAASIAYAEMRRSETTAERRDFLRQSLLSYCKRDTEAEFQLYRVLVNRTLR